MIRTATMLLLALAFLAAAALRLIAGIHPHLAMFSNEGERGDGLVVPLAGAACLAWPFFRGAAC